MGRELTGVTRGGARRRNRPDPQRAALGIGIGIGHVLPDFGLSRSGAWSVEGVLVHTAPELRETLPRYEARLVLDDLETDLDDSGQPIVIVRGRVAGTRAILTIDPLRRCIRAVRLG